MRGIFRAVVFAAAFLFGGAAAHACNIPNPNLLAPPFVDGCALPAAALNNLVLPRSVYTPTSGTQDVAFQAADAAAKLAGHQLYLATGTVSLSSNYTMTAPLDPSSLGIIKPANGVTLTAYAPPGLPANGVPTQLFDTSIGGGIAFTNKGRSYVQQFGVIADGASHTGNAIRLQGALQAAAGGGIVDFSIGSGPVVMEAAETISANNITLYAAPGNNSVGSITFANGIASTPLHFTTTTGLTIAGLTIDGNKAGQTVAWSCVTVDNVAVFYVDATIHDCSGDNLNLSGTGPGRIYGTYYNAGLASLGAASGVGVNLNTQGSIGGTPGIMSGVTVDITTHDDVFAGLGVGYMSDSDFTVRAWNIDPSHNWGECITGYYDGNVRNHYHVECNTSGNHGVHVGGSDSTIDGTIVNTYYDGLLLESRHNELDGTVSSSGTLITASGGQNFTAFYHSCQSSSHYSDARCTLKAAGQTLTVAYAPSDTTLVTTAAASPALAGATYVLTNAAGSFTTNWKVNLVLNNTVTIGYTGIHAAFQCDVCSTVDAHIVAHGMNSLGVLCAACIGAPKIDFNGSGAVGDGVVMSSSFAYSTGTIGVTNGSKNFTGAGTAFLSNIAPGDTCKDTTNNDVYNETVATVTSDTAGTWAANYAGTSGSTHNYHCGAATMNAVVYAVAPNVQLTPGASGGDGVLFSDVMNSVATGDYAGCADLAFNDGSANAGNYFVVYGVGCTTGTFPGSLVHGDTDNGSKP